MQIKVSPTLIVNAKLDKKASVDLIWLAHLLKDIGRGSSLVVASKNSGTSYRGAWGKLNQVEDELGIPLIVQTKGHGFKLTEFGAFLIRFIEDIQAEHLKQDTHYHERLLKEIKKIQKSESAR